MTQANEEYKGDALLQKTFIADLFTRQSKKNNGELPQYYVHDCHPAIIDELTFQRVQEEIARRSSLKKVSASAKTELAKYSGKYVLTEILSCGNCCTPYKRAVWRNQYDFGDSWEHLIEVQDILFDYDKYYANCLAGEGNAPPEDVGGEGGYENFMEIMADPKLPEHAEMKEWVSGQ